MDHLALRSVPKVDRSSVRRCLPAVGAVFAGRDSGWCGIANRDGNPDGEGGAAAELKPKSLLKLAFPLLARGMQQTEVRSLVSRRNEGWEVATYSPSTPIGDADARCELRREAIA